MIVVDFGFALLLGAVLALIVLLGLRREGPGPLSGFLFFFILFFGVLWAASLWLTPVGPQLWGISVLPYVVIALLLLLFVAAITPAPRRPPPRTPTEAEIEEREEAREVAETVLTFSVFFWILLGILAVVIVARYFWITAG
jgi:hypothetical protein